VVAYKGAKNIPVEFALLEGLQHGNNYLWQISLEKTLKRNIQWNIGYEGRKTGNIRVVHVGRAQVRANF
jgi:Leucine-rich repeat (LRR) protein